MEHLIHWRVSMFSFMYFFLTDVDMSDHFLMETRNTEGGIGEIRLHTKQTNYLPHFCFLLWLCIHLSTYLSVWCWVRGPYKEQCCLLWTLGKLSQGRGLWWNGPGRTLTSPLRAEGHAGLAWFACEWELSIILVRELSHRIEKVKTSLYQPFPSETEQAINNWIQSRGKVKHNDIWLLCNGGIVKLLLWNKEYVMQCWVLKREVRGKKW